MPQQADYVVTFGQRYRSETHPTIRNATPDGVVIVTAYSHHHARETVFSWIGREWSDLYPHEGAIPGHYYPQGIVGVLYGDLELSPDGQTRYRIVPGRGNPSDELGPATKVNPEDRPPYQRDGLPWPDEAETMAVLDELDGVITRFGESSVPEQGTHRTPAGSVDAGAGKVAEAPGDTPDDEADRRAAASRAYAERECGDLDERARLEADRAADASGEGEDPADAAPEGHTFRSQWQADAWQHGPRIPALMEAAGLPLRQTPHTPDPTEPPSEGPYDDPEDHACARCAHARAAHEHPTGGRCVVQWGDPAYVAGTAGVRPVKTDGEPDAYRCACDDYLDAELDLTNPDSMASLLEGLRQSIARAYGIDPSEVGVSLPRSSAQTPEDERARERAAAEQLRARRAEREQEEQEAHRRTLERDARLRNRLERGGTRSDIADYLEAAALPEEDETRHTPSGTYATLSVRHEVAGLREDLTTEVTGILDAGLSNIERAIAGPDGLNASVDRLTAAVDGIGGSASDALRYYRRYLALSFVVGVLLAVAIVVGLFAAGVLG